MSFNKALDSKELDYSYRSQLAGSYTKNKHITLTGCVNYYTGKITFEVSNREIVEVYDAVGPAIAYFNSQCGW